MADPHERLPELTAVLERRRGGGDLGPAPASVQIDHALGFAAQVPDAPRHAVDLGTGGGIPGLVLAALCWPDTTWLFVEVRRTRAVALRGAVDALGLSGRIEVAEARAEEVGRSAARGQADLVTARSFGRPALVAECSAPLLAVGGRLVVSEPPGGHASALRWPAHGLALLGLSPPVVVVGPPAFVRIRLTEPCPPRFPRRVGKPERAPLF